MDKPIISDTDQSSAITELPVTAIEPAADWDDLIQPPETLKRLRELARYVEQGDALSSVLPTSTLAKGSTAVLFSGPGGSGKTLAAEVLAKALCRPLYRIDLAQLVSKYIGETEKNLQRLFAAASESNAILLFDEADALFGKRSQVRDHHDRYGNIESSYLLQSIESHQGLVIMATNRKSNIEQALNRRLAYVIEFELPTSSRNKNNRNRS